MQRNPTAHPRHAGPGRRQLPEADDLPDLAHLQNERTVH
jgi:hypothetical protein